jgi:hypothetical protein
VCAADACLASPRDCDRHARRNELACFFPVWGATWRASSLRSRFSNASRDKPCCCPNSAVPRVGGKIYRMKTKEQHRYHGIALAQLAEYREFHAVRRVGSQYGAYEVEVTDKERPIRNLFIKYRSTGRSKWAFAFSRAEVNRIRAVTERSQDVFVALVCANATVCLLDASDLFKVMEDPPRLPQTVWIEDPGEGRSLRVSGQGSTLRRTIAHSAFPREIFR